MAIMERTLVKDAPKEVGKEILLKGFVQTKRDHGSITFVDLRDRTGIVQIVGTSGELKDLKPEYAVEIEGLVKDRPENLVNPKLETGKIEIEAKKVTVLSKASELPFDMGTEKLDLNLPTLLDFRTLSLRHKRVRDIFKVEEAVMEGFRSAAKNLGCTEIFTPTISASSTEGGANVFKFKYYDHEAFLVQSPQLYKQMLVPGFERVFVISHAYRSEPSVTTRHLSESIQMDLEIGFTDFEELMDSLEFIGKETLKYVSETHKDILEEYGAGGLEVDSEVPRLTMREAQKIIKERTGVDHTDEPDLMPEDEREISKWAKDTHKSDLVTITHFPTAKRAFYTMPDPDNPEFSLSYDLLFRGMEVLSGSQRISDYDELIKVIGERGLNPKDFEMYLQAFKYGMPPEGGFSFGLERMTMQILKLENIREATLFPRDMERVDFRLGEKKSEK